MLHQASALDAHEWEEVKCHPLLGVKIVEPVGLPPVAATRSHHEHWNGRGYPDGLAGETMPLLARIVSVAGAYDAITSERPFRDPGTGAAAVAELGRGAGSQFDPGVGEAFLQLPGKWVGRAAGGRPEHYQHRAAAGSPGDVMPWGSPNLLREAGNLPWPPGPTGSR